MNQSLQLKPNQTKPSVGRNQQNGSLQTWLNLVVYSIGGINGFGIRISEVGMAEAEEAGEAVEGAGSPGQSLQIARRRHERLNFSNEARATQIPFDFPTISRRIYRPVLPPNHRQIR